jgi:hypothetical protein
LKPRWTVLADLIRRNRIIFVAAREDAASASHRQRDRAVHEERRQSLKDADRAAIR